jgi:hypothetical protein
MALQPTHQVAPVLVPVLSELLVPVLLKRASSPPAERPHSSSPVLGLSRLAPGPGQAAVLQASWQLAARPVAMSGALLRLAAESIAVSPVLRRLPATSVEMSGAFPPRAARAGATSEVFPQPAAEAVAVSQLLRKLVARPVGAFRHPAAKSAPTPQGFCEHTLRRLR